MSEKANGQSIGLIERLEQNPLARRMDESNPLYWYIHLDQLGKMAQSAETVEKAINEFAVCNPYYCILKVTSKKHLTYDLCATAVRNNGLNLQYVPERFKDSQMCALAVSENGEALSDVPATILTGAEGYKICLLAVGNDVSGRALTVVPSEYLKGDRGRRLCMEAVSYNGYAIRFVPKRLLSKALVKSAFDHQAPTRRKASNSSQSLEMGLDARHWPSLLSFIPQKFLTEELVERAVKLRPSELRDAPDELISKDICLWAIDQDPMNLKYIRNPDNSILEYALQKDPRTIMVAPKWSLTFELCRMALELDPEIPTSSFPAHITEQLQTEGLTESASDPAASGPCITMTPLKSKIPSTSGITRQQAPKTLSKVASGIYDITLKDGSGRTLYYITDLHIEHQLRNEKSDASDGTYAMSEHELRKRIRRKLKTLADSACDSKGILLVGGDVANSIKAESVFYEELSALKTWHGEIICILGNHELLAGESELRGDHNRGAAKSIEDVVSEYREAIGYRATLLENQLYLEYKGRRKVVLTEEEILGSSIDELTEACRKSSLIILGGIGFSGLNPVFNASTIRYNSSITLEVDIDRTKRFQAVYEKVLSCARGLRVIVLTHTQKADWSDDPYNPNWIYVNGHTHQNTIQLDQAAIVLSDNQIGYTPKPWKLKGFSLDIKRVDIFEDYPDGSHEIERAQYIEFNKCMGITMQRMRYPGDIYVLKRSGCYMFVLKDLARTYLLAGGRRYKLAHDIEYYFENLPKYVESVQRCFAPYQKALRSISDEVKELGGSGAIHGCIVDIDFFNHIYLNPYDGKVTPYFAEDMENKIAFENTRRLLEGSPYLPQGETMLKRYSKLSNHRSLPILSELDGDDGGMATVPELVLDRAMYEPSRIMRSMQYIFDQNVVRIWKDEVLNLTLASGGDLPNSGLEPTHRIGNGDQNRG